MKFYRLLFIGWICLAPLSLMAQDNNGKITLTGIVLKMDSIVPVPNTNIFIKTTHMGVHSNEDGIFSIQVQKRDTIVFTSVGSKTTYYVVPDTLKADHYSIIQHMPINNIKLKTVEITSWPSLEQFNQAFTRDHGFDEEMPKARDNANPNLGSISMNKDEIPSTGNYQNRYSNLYENAHIPLNNLLNPKRWNKIVEGIKTGNY